MTNNYSPLRDSVIRNLTDEPVIPISYELPDLHEPLWNLAEPDYADKLKAFEAASVEQTAASKKLYDTAHKIGILGSSFIPMLPVDKRLYLAGLLPPECNSTFNGRADILGWILANCIVDANGLPIFDASDVTKIVGKYSALCYYLAWEALAVNNFTTSDAQELVGNSEGTSNS